MQRSGPYKHYKQNVNLKKGEAIMAVNTKQNIGYFVQLGGIASLVLGVVLSMHHVAIGAAFLGGAVAFYVGEKIRTLA